VSISNRGRSTIWDAKTRSTKVGRRTYSKNKSIKDEVEEGWKYFWAKRKIGIIRAPNFTHQ
jgi:hypothetical protein